MAATFARACTWAALLAVVGVLCGPAVPPPPAGAAAHSGIQVSRGAPDAQVTFRTTRAGEAFLDLTVSARGVSGAEPRHESAVVSLYVDDHYATDVVIGSSLPTPREFALGSL